MELGISGRTALVMVPAADRQGIAESLAREGARVAIASRSREQLEQAAAEIEGETAVFDADTSDLDRLAALPGEVEEALGRSRSLSPTPVARRWAGRSTTARGVGGGLPIAGAGAAGPDRGGGAGDARAGWGRIVNVGSSSVREPIPGLNLSNSHRMAAVGFFKTLASEVAADGITVNTVATGRFATDRLASNWGSWEARERRAPRCPGRTPRKAGGVRRPGRLPLLGAGRLPDRGRDPARRRAAARCLRATHPRPLAHGARTPDLIRRP